MNLKASNAAWISRSMAVSRALGARRRRLAQRAIQTRNGRVDAVEERLLLRGRVDHRLQTLVVRHGRAGLRAEAAAVLRSLEAQAQARERLIRVAEHRVVLAGIHADRPVFALAHAAHVQLQRLPRPKTRGDLLREHLRVARQLERFLRDQPRRRVVAVAVALVSLEPRDEHERPLGADDADDVAEDVFLAPLLQRLVETLGESVIDHRAEVLPIDAVVPVRDQQFLGPDQPEAIEQLGADRVVAGLAARQREQRDSRALAAAQHRQHAAMLVVGMRGGVHRAGGRPAASAASARRRPRPHPAGASARARARRRPPGTRAQRRAGSERHRIDVCIRASSTGQLGL